MGDPRPRIILVREVRVRTVVASAIIGGAARGTTVETTPNGAHLCP